METDNMMIRSRGLVAAALIVLMPVSGALADKLSYGAELKGTSEVPPTDSTGTGSVVMTFDTVSKQLEWKGSYAGLSGEATAAHFHGPAEVGANAGVTIQIPSFKSPFTGTAGLTDAQAADLAVGRLYINVHTAKFPNGEIRGQVLKDK
jgi:CHRD domain